MTIGNGNRLTGWDWVVQVESCYYIATSNGPEETHRSNKQSHLAPCAICSGSKKVAHRWQTSAATVHPTGCATAQEAAERGERASEQVAEKMYQEDTTGIFLGKHAIGYSSTINLLTFGVDIKFIKGLYQGIIKKDWM